MGAYTRFSPTAVTRRLYEREKENFDRYTVYVGGHERLYGREPDPGRGGKELSERRQLSDPDGLHHRLAGGAAHYAGGRTAGQLCAQKVFGHDRHGDNAAGRYAASDNASAPVAAVCRQRRHRLWHGLHQYHQLHADLRPLHRPEQGRGHGLPVGGGEYRRRIDILRQRLYRRQ